MNDSKNIEVMYRHIINIINDNQVENKMSDSFIEKHKELCKKLKVLLDPNLINYQSNMNHINFDLALTSEETNVPERDLKLKFMIKVLIIELKLRIDNKLIFTMNFESKRNKLRSFLQEEKHINHIILMLK